MKSLITQLRAGFIHLAPWQRHGVAMLLGMLTVVGFAPYYVFAVPWLTLTGLLLLLSTVQTHRQAFTVTFSFALGLYGLGIYWIYISLHTFGGMPWWFAGFCTACLCAFMALFPALAAYIALRSGALLAMIPVTWALSDWVRSWIFTGFPWLTMGYSQAPESPLAGFFPLFGVYAVSALTLAIAAVLAALCMRQPLAKRALVGVIAVLILGQGLCAVQWTQAVNAPIRVALLQGNISQSLKWSPSAAEATLSRYLAMVRQSRAQLIVLPETAIPVLIEQLDPAYIDALQQHARMQGGDLLVGVISSQHGRYFNSALSLGLAPSQRYAKSHLVPFGEYIPLKNWFGWIYRDWLHMPLSDLARGHTKAPLQIAGQKVGVNICYEDVFGEEIAQQLPQAELLVNLSNDAWYGESFAAHQHLQFSQVRAIETGRMVLRSTNTGATAIIDVNGRILQHAPHDAPVILQGEAQSYRGQTPYVWWGNWAFLGLCCIFILGVLVQRRDQHIAKSN